MDLYPNHFDTKVNYELYRWKHAITTDDELLAELEDVFKNKHKGHSLQGIICVALGEKDKGLKLLDMFNRDNKEVAVMANASENLRRRRAREHAREIYHEVSLHRDDYF